MPEQRVVNVAYPRKRELPKFNPLVIVIVILVIGALAWILFFRPQAKQEEAQAEPEKQEEATSSAETKEATSSAETTGKKVDTSNWYEYTDVKETFSIRVPKGWFFDKTTKGARDQGKILGGVANFNFVEKSFDEDENFVVYFEQDALSSDISLEKYAARIACIRTNGGNCENPEVPKTQREIKVAEKNSLWQEIHGDDEGIGIEAYIPKSDTEIFVLYTKGKVDDAGGEFKVQQEFVDIVEGMLSTIKFLE